MSKRKTPAPMEKHEQWGKTLYAIRELLFNEDALPKKRLIDLVNVFDEDEEQRAW